MNDAPKKSPGLGLGYQAVSKDDDDIDVGEEVLVIGGEYQNCQGILVSFTEENMRAILRLNHHVHDKTTTVPRALIRKLHPSKLLQVQLQYILFKIKTKIQFLFKEIRIQKTKRKEEDEVQVEVRKDLDFRKWLRKP